jgi:hypothetical protein
VGKLDSTVNIALAVGAGCGGGGGGARSDPQMVQPLNVTDESELHVMLLPASASRDAGKPPMQGKHSPPVMFVSTTPRPE